MVGVGQRQRLQHILRAHQLCMEGFQVLYDGAVCTVWSAPNYCYRCGNRASVLQIDESLGMFFNVFASAPDQGGKDETEKDASLDSSSAYRSSSQASHCNCIVWMFLMIEAKGVTPMPADMSTMLSY